jgi:signal transduction histidine kinase
MMLADLDVADARHLQQRLHDDLGQYLCLAVMQIDEVAAAPEAATLKRTRTLLCGALQELRSLIGGLEQLHDGRHGEPDLAARLAACVCHLNTLQAIPVSCTIEGPPMRRISEQACEILLCATRELLVNACKHGKPAGVDARLSVLPGRLSITVTEHPRAVAGAAPEPGAESRGQGWGLRMTRDGLSRIGARLRWRSGGPGGVQARISWAPQ